MTTISRTAKLVTLINIFTVQPEQQQQLVDLLARATETSVRHAHGFISASLHRSLDGTKVTMYAQWRSVEDYQAMRLNPAPLPYLQQALAIAKPPFLIASCRPRTRHSPYQRAMQLLRSELQLPSAGKRRPSGWHLRLRPYGS